MTHKIINKNFKVYSQNDIQDWKKEIKSLPLEIDQANDTIKSEQLKLNAHKEQLNYILANELKPVDDNISSIQAQIQVITLPQQIEHLKNQMPALEKEIIPKEKALEEVKRINKSFSANISELQRHLEILEHEASIAQLERSLEAKHTAKNNTELLHKNLEQQWINLQHDILTLTTKINLMQTQEEQARAAMYTSSSTSSEQLPSDYTSSQTSHSSSNTSTYTSSQQHHPNSTNTVTYVTRNTFDTNQLTAELKKLVQQQHLVNSQKRQANDEIIRLKSEILSTEKTIRNHQESLEDFTFQEKLLAHAESPHIIKSKLVTEIENKKPYIEQEQELTRSLKNLKTSLKDIKDIIENKQTDLAFFKKNTGIFTYTTDLVDLNTQLSESKKIKEPIVEKKEYMESCIAQVKKSIKEAQSTRDRCQLRLLDLNENVFLKSFWIDPDKLTDELLGALDSKLDYYDNHFFKSSKLAQKAILDIQNQVKKIVEQADYSSSVQYPDLTNYELNFNHHQIKYIQICGVLWEKLNKLNDEDNALAEQLVAILKKHAVASNLAFQELNKLKLDHISDDTFMEHIRQQYDQTRDDLQKFLTPLAQSKDQEALKLSRAGKLLVGVLEKKRQNNTEEQDIDELHFHAKILQTAKALAKSPNHVPTQELFARLIACTDDGKPSWGKKIGGAALMFLGVSLAISAIVCWPLLPALPVAIAATSALGAAAGVLTGLGVKVFNEGLSKGLYSRLTQYAEATKHTTFFSSPGSPKPDHEPRNSAFKEVEENPSLSPAMS